MVAGDLPEDVVRDILSRLAVKSLLRFRCVHSTWNSLLRSSSFVTAHLRNPQNKVHANANANGNGNGNGDGRFLLAKYTRLSRDHDPNESSWLCLLDPGTYDVYRQVQIPFESPDQALYPTPSPRFEVAGSFNGLVCLFASGQQLICLYNPCLGHHKMIPKSPISISASHLRNKNKNKNQNRLVYPQFSFVFGFAYDPIINDYKVVSLVFEGGWGSSLTYIPSYSYSRRAEVYTLGTNCWREVGIPDHIETYPTGNQAVVGGAIHWLGRSLRNLSPGAGDGILSFNVSSEVFRLFWLPEAITNTDANLREWRGFDEMRIDVHGDWLCLLKFVDSLFSRYTCDVWVMKEYGVEESWTKLHANIRFGIIRHPEDFLGIGINGELVFNNIKPTGLTLIHLHDHDHDQEYKYVDVDFNLSTSMCRCLPHLVTNFVESLVSPEPEV